MPAWNSHQLAGLYRRLNEAGVQPVVVGGQAVNLWGEHYRAQGIFPDEVWHRLIPFTSADLDLFGGRGDTARAGKVLGVKPIIYDPFAKTDAPNSGTLYVPLPVNEGQEETGELMIHFLHRVKGLNSDDIPTSAWPVDWHGQEVRVLHPFMCLESKLANLNSLSQEGRQDLKHARICTLAVRAFLQDRLAAGHTREVLKSVERAMRLAGRDEGLLAWYSHGLDIKECIPDDALRSAATREEKARNFLEMRWEQLQAILTGQRDEFAAASTAQGVAQCSLDSLLPPISTANAASFYLAAPEETAQGQTPSM